MLTLSTAGVAALQRSPLPLAALVEMDLTQPLYLNSSGVDLTLNGSTYTGAGTLGSVGQVHDTAAELAAMEFTLSGVPSSLITAALTEPVQGAACRIKLAIFDPDTYQVTDVVQQWAGRLDVMAIEDGAESASIKVSAEHAGIDLIRPTTALFSDSDQRRLYAGDPSLQFMADQIDMRIVWPTAQWYRDNPNG